MILENDCSIERLALSFIDCTLPKTEWTHAAHFAATIWILRKRPKFAEPESMRTLIVRYNEATGTANTDTSGYHHTVTLASIRAAASHLEGHSSDTPLQAVLKSLVTSPFGRPDWLLSYWRSDTLFSVTARRMWAEPDIKALPF